MVEILKTEYLDTPLAPLALLVDKNLATISRMAPHDLLEFYLKEDIQKFKKIR
ncbi:MAG: hypothetical protein IH584_00890 [Candidatus Aminicenantes bacterium]|nr:hypothetical protein [Candidatus Aminicenantes bacterium]